MRWIQFIQERFNPLAYGTMILLVCLAHTVTLVTVFQQTWNLFIPLILFFSCFFFKLRCYDEIKDYEHDLIHNPLRPLARGLITKKALGFAIVFCWMVEILSLISIGIRTLLFVFPVLVYTLLMYKEFFIGKILKPYLTTYATLHTFVFFLLSAALFFSFQKNQEFTIILILSLPHWFFFNLSLQSKSAPALTAILKSSVEPAQYFYLLPSLYWQWLAYLSDFEYMNKKLQNGLIPTLIQ
jgi:hypothetical protein